MTELNLDEIRARAERAAPGPWSACDTHLGEETDDCTCYGGSTTYGHEPGCGFIQQADLGSVANAQFVAHAREDVPALIAEVERLDAIVVRARDLLDKWNANGALSGENGTRFLDRRELTVALTGEETGHHELGAMTEQETP